jgi:ribosomal protein S26
MTTPFHVNSLAPPTPFVVDKRNGEAHYIIDCQCDANVVSVRSCTDRIAAMKTFETSRNAGVRRCIANSATSE